MSAITVPATSDANDAKPDRWKKVRSKGKKKAVTYFQLFKRAGSDWSEDKASRLAAALAFYTMLSIGPLLIVTIRIVSAVWLNQKDAAVKIYTYAEQNMGKTAADALAQMLNNAGEPKSSLLATIVSIAVLIFSASGVFGELQDSLNTIWEVKPRPDRGILGIIKDRFFSIVLVLGTAFLLIVSLVASTALTAITKWIGGEGWMWEAINFVASFVVITGLFALIFKYLPDVRMAWKHVWFGAIVTGILFTIGKFILGWYLGQKSTTNVYGAAGSLVAMLLWTYYSAQILFFGAEMVQAHAALHDDKPKPKENAVKVTTEERRNLGLVSPEQIKAAAYRADNAHVQVKLPPRKKGPPSPAMATAIAAGGAVLGVVATELVEKIARKRDRRQELAERVGKRLALIDDRFRRFANHDPLPAPSTAHRRNITVGRALACTVARSLEKLPQKS